MGSQKQCKRLRQAERYNQDMIDWYASRPSKLFFRRYKKWVRSKPTHVKGWR